MKISFNEQEFKQTKNEILNLLRDKRIIGFKNFDFTILKYGFREVLDDMEIEFIPIIRNELVTRDMQETELTKSVITYLEKLEL